MMQELRKVAPLFSCYIRAQEGEAFLGRMSTEQTAELRRVQRMVRAGDLPGDADIVGHEDDDHAQFALQ